jgi:hypothetical protein
MHRLQRHTIDCPLCPDRTRRAAGARVQSWPAWRLQPASAGSQRTRRGWSNCRPSASRLR